MTRRARQTQRVEKHRKRSEGKKYRRGRRRKMTKFTLGEISAVDRPAQEPAVNAIIKQGFPQPREGESRDDFISRMASDPEKRSEFPNRAQLIAAAASVFERARARKENDVDVTKQTPRDGESMDDFVQRMMDDENMSASAARRMFRAEMNKAAGDMADILTGSTDGHQHGIHIYHGHEGMKLMVAYASGPEGEMHDHQIMRMPDGKYVMSENMGHTHDIDEMSMTQVLMAMMAKADADDAYDEFPLTFAGQELRDLPEVQKALESPNTNREEDGMSDDLRTAQEEIDSLKRDLATLGKVAGLSDAHKAHYNKLSQGDQSMFLELNAAARDHAVAKALEADPVVYTDTKGREYRKSAGQYVIEQAQEMDELRKELAKARVREADDKITKAAEELSHLPGDLEARKALVKAVSSIADEDQRTKALDALKAHDAGLGNAFIAHGIQGGHKLEKSVSTRKEAEAEMERLTKEIQKRDGLDYIEAYHKASEENANLYKAAVGA